MSPLGAGPWVVLTGALVLQLVGGCESDVLIRRSASEFFEPPTVDFGEVLSGRTARAYTRFQNASDRELLVSGVTFEPAADAFAAFLQAGGTLNGSVLAPGAGSTVEIRFGPRAEGSYDSTMRVEADDLSIELPIRARARDERPATPEASPPYLEFATVAPGEDASRTLEVRNVGDSPGRLVLVEVEPPAFFVTGAAGGLALPVVLESGASMSLDVWFAPTEPEREHRGIVIVAFDSGARVEVPVRGRSASTGALRCPPRPIDFGTVPRGRSVSRVVPCQVEGERWAFERADFAPGSAPVFRLDGDPVLVSPDRLEVGLTFSGFTEVGRQVAIVELYGSPGGRARLTLTGTVSPPLPGEADLALELTWNTPYSDFDLHLVRDGGMAFEAADDCYFASKRPDWGRAGDRSDDPFLDRDDREGYGPETIALVHAAEPAFDVYVQYHDFTRGFVEPSTVVVTFTLRGGASGRLARDLLDCGAWWHVGRIHRGPPLRFEPVDAVSSEHRLRAAERCW